MPIRRFMFLLAILAPAGAAAQGPLFSSRYLFFPIESLSSAYSGNCAVGDLNHDGILDLVISDSRGPAMIRLGTGGGMFGSQTPVPSVTAALAVALAEVSGDASLDLLVVAPATLVVMDGDGNGGFSNPRSFPLPSTTSPYPDICIALADFNHDSRSDVAVGTQEANLLSILLGQSGGTFAARTDYYVSGITGVAITDFNNDTHPDWAACSNNGRLISYARGLGNGSFGPVQGILSNAAAEDICAGLFNGDLNVDLVVAHRYPAGASVLFGNGGGSFALAPMVDTGSPARDVATGNFSSDGKSDLALAREDGNVALLPGLGDGTFGPRQTFRGGYQLNSILVRDVNGDGRSDLVATGSVYKGGASILLGNGDNTFGGRSIATGPAPVASSVADFDQDLRPDIVTACNDALYVNHATTLGWFDAGSSIPTVPISSVFAGRLDADSSPDILTANGNAHTISVFKGNGDLSFQPRVDFLTASLPSFATAADLDNDLEPDLIVANEQSSSISVFPGRSGGIFGPKRDTPLASSPMYVALGDMDGDARLDAVVALGSGGLSVLRGPDGSGGFASRSDFGTEATSCATGDLDGDTKLDAATSGSFYTTVFRGTGDGSFDQRSILFDGSGERTATALLDVNGDGALDLVYANSMVVTLQPGFGDGTFAGPQYYGHGLAGLSPRQLGIGDLNADGRPDLVVPGHRANEISIFYNLGSASPGLDPVRVESVDARSDRVAVTWKAGHARGDEVHVYRRRGNTNWVRGALVTVGADGHFRHEDSDVEVGAQYDYQLGIATPEGEQFAGLATAVVPGDGRFRFLGPRPNPAGADLRVAFYVPEGGDVGLEVMDVQGRRIIANKFEALRPGTHVLPASSSHLLRPGIYLVRVTSSGVSDGGRVVVVQ